MQMTRMGSSPLNESNDLVTLSHSVESTKVPTPTNFLKRDLSTARVELDTSLIQLADLTEIMNSSRPETLNREQKTENRKMKRLKQIELHKEWCDKQYKKTNMKVNYFPSGIGQLYYCDKRAYISSQSGKKLRNLVSYLHINDHLSYYIPVKYANNMQLLAMACSLDIDVSSYIKLEDGRLSKSKGNGVWLRDLTTEGIEPNPGWGTDPLESSYYFKRDADGVIDYSIPPKDEYEYDVKHVSGVETYASESVHIQTKPITQLSPEYSIEPAKKKPKRRGDKKVGSGFVIKQCYAFAKYGTCKYGNKCHFDHNPPVGFSSPIKGKSKNDEPQVCRHFKSHGHCGYKDCKFEHPGKYKKVKSYKKTGNSGFKHKENNMKKQFEMATDNFKSWRPKTEPGPKVNMESNNFYAIPIFHEEEYSLPVFHDDLSKIESSISTTQRRPSLTTTIVRPSRDPSPSRNITVNIAPPIVKRSEQLEEEIKCLKLQDELDVGGSLWVSLQRNRFIINNNKNRDLRVRTSKYEIDERVYMKYCKDLDGVEMIGLIPKKFFIEIPEGFLEQLETSMALFQEYSKENYQILRAYCHRLLKQLSITAVIERDCVVWCPIIVWHNATIRHQITNPYNELREHVIHNDFTTLSFIDGNDGAETRYKRHGIGCKKFDPLNKNQYKTKKLYSLVNKIRLIKNKVCNYWQNRHLKRYVKNQLLHCFIGPLQQHQIRIEPAKLLSHYSAGGWIRDLTECGVEPNPGPNAPLDIYEPLEQVKIKPKAYCKYPMDYTKQQFKKLHVPKGEQHSYFWNHNYRPMSFANTQENEENVVKSRVIVDTPPADESYMKQFIRWVKRHYKKLFNSRIHKVYKVTFDEYIERSNASPAVKKILRTTYEKLCVAGIDENSILSPEIIHQYVRRSLFLKKENLCYRTPAGVKDKAPRAIQGATPEFICLVGPWIMALQDAIKKIWSSKNWCCFTSGVRSDKAAQLINEPWQFVEDDIKTFDSSVCENLLQLELWIARKFGAPRAVRDLMLENCNTHGYTFFGAKYYVPGCRKSGDPYTSLFNSMLNAFMHAFIIGDWLNWSIDEVKEHVRMLVAGDDNAMCINSEIRIPFVYCMSRLGFSSEALYRDSIFDLEFCSCRVYDVDGQLTFGPMPGKVLSKLGYLNNPPANVTRESMMKGIALGLKHSCYFIPPLRAVIDCILRLTRSSVAYEGPETKFKKDDWHMNFVHVNTKFTASVYVSLFCTYGWTYDMQRGFEEYLAKVTFDCVLSYTPVLYILIDFDVSGFNLFKC